MPELTRRRYKERPDSWHIYFGDVQAGTIARRTGAPIDKDQWEWSTGFYPGSNPGEITHGTAAGFDQARARFEEAWRVFLSKRTEADFQEWRDARDWTARKYAMWAAGERLPNGRQLVTLKDAGAYITKLPKAEHDAPEWEAAMEALILVAEKGGPTMFARIGVMRALNRHVPRAFNPDRKDHHWGKRKLKRDQ